MAASARADPDEEQPPREQPHRERRNRIAATFATADMVGNSRSPNGKYRRALPGFAFGDPRRHEYRRFAPGRPKTREEIARPPPPRKTGGLPAMRPYNRDWGNITLVLSGFGLGLFFAPVGGPCRFFSHAVGR